jgi:hypothetical protein
MATQNVQVHVQRIESLSRGRLKVKIAETNLNLGVMTHQGKQYEISNKLGRGRYIMKPLDNIVKAVPRKFVRGAV